MGRDVVVIGGSAGAIEPLRDIVRALPRDFAAAVMVVVHIPAESGSVLPSILQRGSAISVAHAVHGQRLEAGHVYVAPPDQHLLVHDGRVRLWRGPRENHHRPAIDVLFRTAARWFGPRAIGVVLSGALDDGAAGMFALKARGGVAIAQDPEEALYAGIPQSVIDHVAVDHVVSAHDISSLLLRKVAEPIEEDVEMSHKPTEPELPELEPLELDPEIDALREERCGSPTVPWKSRRPSRVGWPRRRGSAGCPRLLVGTTPRCRTRLAARTRCAMLWRRQSSELTG
jgi:two-component system, chemotaxis family, protein-glutamate methylesterase/glutaminase